MTGQPAVPKTHGRVGIDPRCQHEVGEPAHQFFNLVVCVGALRTNTLEAVTAHAKPIKERSIPSVYNAFKLEIGMKCGGCHDGVSLPFEFKMAFQPIVDMNEGSVWGYEALVRGAEGGSAYSVLSQVTEETRYKFDQAARVLAIESAGRLFEGRDLRLSINFMPNAVYEPSACIQKSLAAAKRANFPHQNLMFEFTENERMEDVAHVQRIVDAYRKLGFWTALDDFGAGYAGLGLLAKLQPDLIKIDMELLRGIDSSQPKQAIVAGIVGICRQLDITVLAEGVETADELAVLRAAGIRLFQGYYLAKPALMSLPRLSIESLNLAANNDTPRRMQA